jgi:hypothetical protein
MSNTAPQVSAGARFYGFVVFSNRYKALGDTRLATLAWSLRMLLALLFLLPFLIYRILL